MLFLCIICWGIGYNQSVGFPVYGEVTATPLWNTVCVVLPGKIGTYLMGLSLMLGGAFFVYRANYALMLIREKTLFPFLFYIFLTSTNPDFIPLRVTSVGVFCLILALYQLFISYHDPEARDRLFNTTLFISVGSLLWMPLLWFVPLFWLGMYNFKSFSIRSFSASLLGIITIYWFILGWCVWQEDLSALTIPFSYLFKIQFTIKSNIDITFWLQILLIVVMTVIASINIIMHEYEDNQRTRQFLSFLIIMFIWSFGIFFLYGQSIEEFQAMACVPSSILIAHFFTVIQGKYLYWFFHLFIIASILLFLVRVWNFL